MSGLKGVMDLKLKEARQTDAKREALKDLQGQPGVRINVTVPRQLHKKFKALCAINDQDMSALMLESINSYVEKHAHLLKD